MGYGNYSHAAHEALSQARADLPRQRIFVQDACHALMNPKGVRVRESRDSDEHPNALPIVFALDVTGSMGDIPDLLARRELPRFMKILGDLHVPDPQLLFMALGDATCDRAPLQVGQFESTAELMDQWLTFSFLEGGGGGQNTESYELALYFLAEHTDTDAWTKRKKRGYIFMTGDELPYPAVSRHQVEAIIGDKLDADVPTEAVVAAVSEAYEPFFLIPDRGRARGCERRWRELLGDHTICMDTPTDTCFVAAGIVALKEGAVEDLDQVAKLIEQVGLERQRVGQIVRALTPLAATLDRDGAPPPTGVAHTAKAVWQRLFKK